MANDKIYTTPANRMEPPRRRVPLRVTYAFFLPLWGGWAWLTWGEDRHWTTWALAVFGLSYIGRGCGQVFVDERATQQELKRMKAERA